jgi:hypothetical protein
MSLNLDIDSLPPEKVEAAITRLEAMKAQRAAENKLAYYRPYPKQVAFHAAGVRCRERLLIAANQSGKSLAGAMECAMHATGRYPDWWKGRRFDKPTIGWGAGTTNETTRGAPATACPRDHCRVSERDQFSHNEIAGGNKPRAGGAGWHPYRIVIQMHYDVKQGSFEGDS